MSAPDSVADRRLTASTLVARRDEPGNPALAARALYLLAVASYRLVPAAIVAALLTAIGTRRDVLPVALCDELKVLQDAVAPLSPAEAQAAFAEAYGGSRDAVFAQLDDRPVASGSIACVYRASLVDGRDVAVKLQRPGIRSVVARDLALITVMARAL